MPDNLKSLKDRAEKLRQTIDLHRYNYHVLDREEISAEALDSLKRELAELEAAHPELQTKDSPTLRVAGKPLPQFEKVPHKVTQWSSVMGAQDQQSGFGLFDSIENEPRRVTGQYTDMRRALRAPRGRSHS